MRSYFMTYPDSFQWTRKYFDSFRYFSQERKQGGRNTCPSAQYMRGAGGSNVQYTSESTFNFLTECPPYRSDAWGQHRRVGYLRSRNSETREETEIIQMTASSCGAEPALHA